MIAWASAGGAKRAFSPWNLGLGTKYLLKKTEVGILIPID